MRYTGVKTPVYRIIYLRRRIMEKFKAFLKRKDIEISLKRYGIDALGAMAQGLFCSLLIGTIINTIGTQFKIPFLTATVATVGGTDYTVGGLASAMSGPAMAVAIGYALHCPPLVLLSLKSFLERLKKVLTFASFILFICYKSVFSIPICATKIIRIISLQIINIQNID